jgi:hypothetical protein
VSEEFLDGAKVGSGVEEVGGVGVPQAMGVEAAISSQCNGIELEDAAGSAVGEPLAAVIEEEGSFAARRAAGVEPPGERLEGFGGYWNPALLFPLAHDKEPALNGIDVAHAESDKLADAEAATVEEFEEGEIALGHGAFELAGGDVVDEAVALAFGGDRGQVLGHLGGEEEFGVVDAEDAFADEVLEEAAEGRELAADGRLGEPLLMEIGEPLAQEQLVEFLRLRRGLAAAAEVGEELIEIGAVVADGVSGGVLALE